MISTGLRTTTKARPGAVSATAAFCSGYAILRFHSFFTYLLLYDAQWRKFSFAAFSFKGVVFLEMAQVYVLVILKHCFNLFLV